MERKRKPVKWKGKKIEKLKKENKEGQSEREAVRKGENDGKNGGRKQMWEKQKEEEKC